MTTSSGRRGAWPVAMANGLRRWSSTQLAPITPPKPVAASALPSGPTRAAWPSIEPAAASTPSTAADPVEGGGVDPLPDLALEGALHRRRPAHDDVDALVGVLEDAVEGLAHGVGEDQGAGHEGHAEDDGEAGEDEAQLVGPQALPGEPEHGPYLPNVFMRSRTASAVGSLDLVDDAAVGQEDDPVGVAGRARVVGHHDDGLAQLPDRPAHEVEDLGPGAAVEVAGGLVGEDDLRPPGQGPGHRHPLLLAAGQLARPVLRAGRARPMVSITWSSHAWSGLRPARSIGQGDVLQGGERRHQVVGLEDEADLVPAQEGEVLVVEGGEVGVADEDLAAR